jgi:hypothetical protein
MYPFPTLLHPLNYNKLFDVTERSVIVVSSCNYVSTLAVSQARPL